MRTWWKQPSIHFHISVQTPTHCCHLVAVTISAHCSSYIGKKCMEGDIFEKRKISGDMIPVTSYYAMMMQMPNLCVFITHKLIACLLALGCFGLSRNKIYLLYLLEKNFEVIETWAPNSVLVKTFPTIYSRYLTIGHQMTEVWYKSVPAIFNRMLHSAPSWRVQQIHVFGDPPYRHHLYYLWIMSPNNLLC